MNVFTIPENLSHHYHGCGVALGTTDTKGNITSLLYVRDLIPGLDPGLTDIMFNKKLQDDVIKQLTQPRIASIARKLEENFGTVRIGVVSCWEFREL